MSGTPMSLPQRAIWRRLRKFVSDDFTASLWNVSHVTMRSSPQIQKSSAERGSRPKYSRKWQGSQTKSIRRMSPRLNLWLMGPKRDGIPWSFHAKHSGWYLRPHLLHLTHSPRGASCRHWAQLSDLHRSRPVRVGACRCV